MANFLCDIKIHATATGLLQLFLGSPMYGYAPNGWRNTVISFKFTEGIY